MNNVTKWKSTVLGLIALLIPIAVTIGWIDPEKQGPIAEKLPLVVEAVFALVAAVLGFVGIFKMNDDG